MMTLILKATAAGRFCLGNPLCSDNLVDGVRHIAVTGIPSGVGAAQVVSTANRCHFVGVSSVDYGQLRPGRIIRNREV